LQNEKNGKKQVSCSETSMKGLMMKEIKAELDNIHSTSAPAFANYTIG